jgi:hypothetical protein
VLYNREGFEFMNEEHKIEGIGRLKEAYFFGKRKRMGTQEQSIMVTS